MADDRDEPAVDGADAAPTPQETEPPTPPPAAPRSRFRWRRWLFGTLGFIVLFPIVLIVLWTVITLNYVYSRGERSGYIQKFSEKGWLCKTWEGELAQATIPGTLTDKFYFTVRDDSLAAVIDSLNRTWDGRVAVHYEQHRGVPFTCFGETQYFVDRVTTVSPLTPRQAPTPPPSTVPPSGTQP